MKKSIMYFIITVCAVVAAVSLTYGISAGKESAEYERLMSANYQHAFKELVSGVSDVDTSLQKSLIVTSPTMAGAVCSELYATAQTAEMALGVLPFTASEMEKTAGFLNRVGDYALSLSQKAYKGESFSDEDLENLRALSEVASVMSQNLKSIEEGLGSELVTLDQYLRTVQQADQSEEQTVPQTLADSMSIAETEFPEVPSLIYDGPFSEHLTNVSPRLLENCEDISQSQGRDAAAAFIGARKELVYASGEMDGDIPCWRYECEVKGSTVVICVSKCGGKVLSVLSSRLVETAQVDAQQAVDAAKAFLRQKGFDSLKDSYYMISDNVLTANFAYEQDGVICYSDLIKVGIALDDCTLKSFEASGYITSHYERELPAPQVSTEQAQEKVPADLKVNSSRVALIPTAGKAEILCYEFECADANGQKYIIYVNAVTGEQEKILILLEDENGTLTI